MKVLFLLLSTILSFSTSIFAGETGWKNDELVIKYHYNSQLQEDWAFRALQKVDIKENSKILDFGSGDGKISAALSVLGKSKVAGFDISEPMIDFAKSLYPNDSHSQLSFHLLNDTQRIPNDESFDLVTSFCVFHLLDKPAETLVALSKSLKKGGKLLVTLPAGGNKDFFDAVNKTFKKYEIQPPWTNKIQTTNEVNVRDIKKLEQIAVESGFKPLKAEIVRNKNRFINKRGMTDWFIGTLTANWNIKDEIRNEFFGDLTDCFLEACPDAKESNGAIRFELDRIYFLASKI